MLRGQPLWLFVALSSASVLCHFFLPEIGYYTPKISVTSKYFTGLFSILFSALSICKIVDDFAKWIKQKASYQHLYDDFEIRYFEDFYLEHSQCGPNREVCSVLTGSFEVENLSGNNLILNRVDVDIVKPKPSGRTLNCSIVCENGESERSNLVPHRRKIFARMNLKIKGTLSIKGIFTKKVKLKFLDYNGNSKAYWVSVSLK